MANKKFYYRNKNKKPLSQQNEAAVDVFYTADQLSVSVRDLGIGESLCELLEKNRVATAGDLVRRTEKDMYRVQGFNKKMLFEVRDALKKAGMAFRAEVQKKPEQNAKPEQNTKPEQNAKKEQSADKNGAQRAKDGGAMGGDARSSKFGLADRRGDRGNKPQQAQKQAPQQHRPEKLTAPLAVENWRKIMKGGKWGFSDGFKTVIPAMYDEVFCFKEGLASVEIDGKCGFIDSENNIAVPFDYDIAMSFSDGLAMVARGEKCGYINKNNEVVIPFEYDAGTPFEDGEAKVKKEGKWATVTKENKLTWI